ncbi:MAG: PHP domain-containing protein [Desulfurococcaceae archaeon]
MGMLIRADLHVHSLHSDGRASPAEIVYASIERGINAVAIADHDTFAGSIVARKLSVGNNLLVVPSAEVRTDRGDVLLYCDEEVDFPKRLDLLIDKAKEESCLIVPAHPFDIARLGLGDAIFEYEDWSAIEIWNSSSTKGANYRAIKASKLLGKPGIANSDAHILAEIATAYTVIEVEELSVSSVLDAIRRGKVKPVFGGRPLTTLLDRISWSLERSVKKALK